MLSLDASKTKGYESMNILREFGLTSAQKNFFRGLSVKKAIEVIKNSDCGDSGKLLELLQQEENADLYRGENLPSYAPNIRSFLLSELSDVEEEIDEQRDNDEFESKHVYSGAYAFGYRFSIPEIDRSYREGLIYYGEDCEDCVIVYEGSEWRHTKFMDVFSNVSLYTLIFMRCKDLLGENYDDLECYVEIDKW